MPALLARRERARAHAEVPAAARDRFELRPDPAADAVRSARTIAARDTVFRRALVGADLVSAAVALAVCVTLVGEGSIAWASVLALVLVVAIGKLNGLYDRDDLLIRKTTIDEAPQLFQVATLSTLVFWLLDGQLVNGELGDTQVVGLWATLFCASFLARRAARIIAHRLTAVERCLFIGDASAYERLRDKFAGAGVEAVLVGRMSLQRTGRHSNERDASEEELRELLSWTDVHRVIIDPQTLPPQEMLEFVRAAKGVGARVSLLPRVLDVVGSSVVFDDLNGVTLLGVRRFGLTRSSYLLKRLFDLVGAGVALLVFGPLMTIIAVAVKLDSPGPALFRQTRVGRDGRHFRICKFRTMCSDAEQRKEELRSANEAQGGLFKIEDDPRITRVGRLLRRTSLDELPQLLNVLTGSMSLVGPRPLVLDEDQQIKGYDRRRLQLTPGMTGPWQILGSKRVPLQEMVKIDYLYVGGWSLWQDVKIMLRTVPHMLARRGM